MLRFKKKKLAKGIILRAEVPSQLQKSLLDKLQMRKAPTNLWASIQEILICISK